MQESTRLISVSPCPLCSLSHGERECQKMGHGCLEAIHSRIIETNLGLLHKSRPNVYKKRLGMILSVQKEELGLMMEKIDKVTSDRDGLSVFVFDRKGVEQRDVEAISRVLDKIKAESNNVQTQHILSLMTRVSKELKHEAEDITIHTKDEIDAKVKEYNQLGADLRKLGREHKYITKRVTHIERVLSLQDMNDVEQLGQEVKASVVYCLSSLIGIPESRTTPNSTGEFRAFRGTNLVDEIQEARGMDSINIGCGLSVSEPMVCKAVCGDRGEVLGMEVSVDGLLAVTHNKDSKHFILFHDLISSDETDRQTDRETYVTFVDGETYLMPIGETAMMREQTDTLLSGTRTIFTIPCPLISSGALYVERWNGFVYLSGHGKNMKNMILFNIDTYNTDVVLVGVGELVRAGGSMFGVERLLYLATDFQSIRSLSSKDGMNVLERSLMSERHQITLFSSFLKDEDIKHSVVVSLPASDSKHLSSYQDYNNYIEKHMGQYINMMGHGGEMFLRLFGDVFLVYNNKTNSFSYLRINFCD